MNAEWFAGRLRELRESAGLSRQQLADKAGLKLGGIRDLEQGRRSPSWETVVSLCAALKVDCNAFMQKPAELPPLAPGRPRKDEVTKNTRKLKPQPGARLVRPTDSAAAAAGGVGPSAVTAAGKRGKGK